MDMQSRKDQEAEDAQEVTALSTVLCPIHEAGYPFIAGMVALTLVGFFISEELGFFLLVILAWMVYFFRDPPRWSPIRRGLVLAPGDGRVSMIAQVPLPKELQGESPEDDDNSTEAETLYNRISIFLNVFDVHVNRIPCSGRIEKCVYTPGKFLNAALDKASEDNERTAILMKTETDARIAFTQIAGLVARRIICKAKEGTLVKAGERYGLIRFGSRVDVYLPLDVAPLVAVGQRTLGGETVLADLESTETARQAENR